MSVTDRGPSRGVVAVLGGGVVGVTMAYFLLEEGYEVTLIEQNAEVGHGTSRANGGLVSVGCSHPWNSPSTPMTVLRSWGKVNSPFLFRARAFPGVVPWATRYLLQCRTTSYHRASVASVQLLSDSLERLQRVVSETRLQYDRLQHGILKIFEDPNEVKKDAAHASELAPFGLKYRVLGTDEILTLEPVIKPQAARVAGGLYFPDDESGDACKYTQELARVCLNRGMKLELGTTIRDIILSKKRIDKVVTDRGIFQADQYVLALGAMSPVVARKIQLKLPIYPVKGYSVTIETDGKIALPKVPFLDWGRKMGVTAFGTRIRVGGTAEFAGYDVTPTEGRWRVLHRNLLELFPELSGASSIFPWAGLRPVTPDGMPVLGRTPITNLFLNTGHGPQGWGLACGSAALVTDIMVGRTPHVDTRPFAYERF